MLCTKSMVLPSLTSQPPTPLTTRYVSPPPGSSEGTVAASPSTACARGPGRLRAGRERQAHGLRRDAGTAALPLGGLS